MPAPSPAPAFLGVYLIYGADATGPWYYVGKGDHVRAEQSRVFRGGRSFQMLATGLGPAEAYRTEAVLIAGLQAAGVRLLNAVAGHGVAGRTPHGSLAATMSPAGGAQTLTLAQLGVGLVVALTFGWGSAPTATNVVLEARQAWALKAPAVAKIEALAEAGTPARLFAVAKGGPILATFVITGLRRLGPAAGPNEGRWEFDLATDLSALGFQGHRLPIPPNSGVRYVTPQGASAADFLVC